MHESTTKHVWPCSRTGKASGRCQRTHTDALALLDDFRAQHRASTACSLGPNNWVGWVRKSPTEAGLCVGSAATEVAAVAFAASCPALGCACPGRSLWVRRPSWWFERGRRSSSR
jgi:hypothetical protein